MRKAIPGQSLTEYGMIAALVGVASIGALVLLGGSLSDGLEGLWSQAPATSPQVIATTSGNSANPASPTEAVTPHPIAGTQPLSITLANGKTITLDAFPTDLAKTVETLGTNGTTDVLANNVKSMADQLLASGQITPEQLNLFTQLANQGHRIAAIERLLEDRATKSGTSKSAFLDTPITFEGKQYDSPLVLADSIGYTIEKQPGSDQWLPGDNESGVLLDLQKQLADSGALSDPKIKTIVDDLVFVINEVGDHVQNNVYSIEEKGLSPADFNKQVLSGLREQGLTLKETASLSDKVSGISDGASTDICKNGKGNDTGQKCSG